MISAGHPLSSLSPQTQVIFSKLKDEIEKRIDTLPCKAIDIDSNHKALLFKDNGDRNIILLYSGKEGRDTAIKSLSKTGHIRLLYYPDTNTINQVMKLVLRATPNSKNEKEIVREAQLVEELQSNPFIVRQHGWVMYDGSHDKMPFTKVIMVHKLYEANLYSYIQDQEQFRKFSFSKQFWIFQSLLDGLQRLHAQNIVHNDIKGANVLVNPSEKELAYCDLSYAFNECSIKTEEDKKKWVSRGTPNYLAPEKALYLFFKANTNLLKDFTIKSDVFSLGLLFHRIFYEETHFYQTFVGNLFIAHKELEKSKGHLDCVKVKNQSALKFGHTIVSMEENSSDFKSKSNMESLIDGMLYPDPGQRFSSKEAYERLMKLKP